MLKSVNKPPAISSVYS